VDQQNGPLQKLPGAVGRTVLVVEDNKLNRALFCDLLEARGYSVVQTQDGIEALRLTRELKPDLIIMDIQLPDVSGWR
jgi:two-component system cell cycle response regulator DivK